MARDEMPVSDVKRIARLFKDDGISDGTKSKLLYKSGHELLETWSVFEHNRKERAKAAEPKPVVTKEKVEKEVQPEKIEPEPVKEPSAEQSSQSIQSKLQLLLSSLPAHSLLESEALSFLANSTNDTDHFLNGVNNLVENLEKHLVEWKKVKELAKSKSLSH
jgi:ParB family chromosome partitioning protein